MPARIIYPWLWIEGCQMELPDHSYGLYNTSQKSLSPQLTALKLRDRNSSCHSCETDTAPGAQPYTSVTGTMTWYGVKDETPTLVVNIQKL
ncbi:hypothetical protein RRG08_045153 [Elysia crispata]|uniref:Uncharacterized protein n=1 Tax=Elysia crispata TaxID=231223 RepID=A0AAE1A3N1_9GAST|nr:hypothetical protein RRG08_045153 [Elysia crispata]